MRRGRRARRGTRHAHQGLLRAQSRRAGRRGPSQGAARPREGQHRAVQVPARSGFCGQAATHRNRQAAALQTKTIPLRDSVYATPSTPRLGQRQGLCQRHQGARRHGLRGRPDRLECAAAIRV